MSTSRKEKLDRRSVLRFRSCVPYMRKGLFACVTVGRMYAVHLLVSGSVDVACVFTVLFPFATFKKKKKKNEIHRVDGRGQQVTEIWISVCFTGRNEVSFIEPQLKRTESL